MSKNTKNYCCQRSCKNGKLRNRFTHYSVKCKEGETKLMIIIQDPRSKALSSDEETVEILEIIENCDDYSDLDDQDRVEYEYDFEEIF